MVVEKKSRLGFAFGLVRVARAPAKWGVRHRRGAIAGGAIAGGANADRAIAGRRHWQYTAGFDPPRSHQDACLDYLPTTALAGWHGQLFRGTSSCSGAQAAVPGHRQLFRGTGSCSGAQAAVPDG